MPDRSLLQAPAPPCRQPTYLVNVSAARNLEQNRIDKLKTSPIKRRANKKYNGTRSVSQAAQCYMSTDRKGAPLKSTTPHICLCSFCFLEMIQRTGRCYGVATQRCRMPDRRVEASRHDDEIRENSSAIGMMTVRNAARYSTSPIGGLSPPEKATLTLKPTPASAPTSSGAPVPGKKLP